MKTAIGGTWLFQIVVVMLLLFTGYLSLSVNYSKAFNVKNEILQILERHNGNTKEAREEINSYLNSVGYRTTGDCGENRTDVSNNDLINDWTGYNSRGNDTAGSGWVSETNYCIRELYVTPSDNPELPYSSYYQIKVFFKLDIPVLSYVFTFNVKGDTKIIYYPEND